MKKIRVVVSPFRDLILFPNACLPMFVFEQDYLEMIKDCQRQNLFMAIGLGDSVHNNYGQEVPGVLSPRQIMGIGQPRFQPEYGNNYVCLQGKGKVRLLRPLQTLPYLIYEAEVLEEQEDSLDKDLELSLSHLKATLFNWIDRYIHDLKQKELFLGKIKTIPQVVDHLCLFLVQDREVKQILLETKTLSEKVRILDMLIHGQTADRENGFYSNILKWYEEMEDLQQAVQ